MKKNIFYGAEKNLSKKAVLTRAKTNTDFLYSRTLFLNG